MSDSACTFLESLQRFDLSMLLRHCRASVEEVEVAFDWVGDITEEAVVVRAPIPIAEALTSLPPQDRKRIAEAVASGQQTAKQHEDICVVTADGSQANGAVALLSELLIHRAMMVSVSTGGPRFRT
ncbi:hypothetical protein [Sphingomonas fennica]|uniref:Uncharacterized protein n=1 Tax=Edaphosphingomonas fennica TaxID=114404 RepID=A0A2T4HVQ7_9SPHN|nr:hypothetical protein [Sphingomonas fennica]PTD19881.1 hypothetical protein CV103_11875 [Sphingomonas fennica]